MKNESVRPLGISILGYLHVIVGPALMIAAFVGPNRAVGAVRLGVGLFELALGTGLLRLSHWARPAAIVAYILNIVAAIAQPNPAAAIVAGAILAYLCTSKVKLAFESHAVERAPSTVPNS